MAEEAHSIAAGLIGQGEGIPLPAKGLEVIPLEPEGVGLVEGGFGSQGRVSSLLRSGVHAIVQGSRPSKGALPLVHEADFQKSLIAKLGVSFFGEDGLGFTESLLRL